MVTMLKKTFEEVIHYFTEGIESFGLTEEVVSITLLFNEEVVFNETLTKTSIANVSFDYVIDHVIDYYRDL